MSEADNRAANNLLLLCLPHAYEVDAFPEHYPAGLLRAWKRGQLADYARAQQGWQITDADAQAALAPVDLTVAIERLAAVVPFNPRMRSRVQAWELAVRKGHARRTSRLTVVRPDRRAAVLAWMAALDDPIVEVPPGQVRVLVGPLGAGKSEQAARWWEQGLRIAPGGEDSETPLYFTPRQITSTLEQAVLAELGRDPTRPCRIVLDDLDEVPERHAAVLLTEARELVSVWPNVSVLATARPGMSVLDEETVPVEPWPVGRGADLAEVALGGPIPSRIWTRETVDLLTSPLTALALAARVGTGRDTQVPRALLLADLVSTVIETHHLDISDDIWQDLAQLATALLDRPDSATTSLFAPLPRLRRLLATDLVIVNDDRLAFVLPVFEQYFGTEAIRSDLVALEYVAAARSFPHWRYALAFAVASSAPALQEELLLRLARVNPAAVFWILDEVSDPDARDLWEAPSDEAITAVIRHRDPAGARTEPDLAIRAGLWFREAEQALLTGLGPLAESLVRHRDGKLVQWGVCLESGYLTLARSRETLPPPQVIALPDPHINPGYWHRGVQFRFPTEDLGRWHLAQRELQEQLDTTIVRQTLPVPRDSWLARERTHLLAAFVSDFGAGRPHRPIRVAELRETVAVWMDKVNASVRASWQDTGRRVDSDDIRWLATQLTRQHPDEFETPWPPGDQPHTGKWAWQSYSPKLTLSLATEMVRQALIGYRQLVETNFASFGDALGLYSMMPVRVEGIIGRFADEVDASSVELHLILHPDPTHHTADRPQVDLRLITRYHDPTFWEFSQAHRHATQTTFAPHPLHQVDLPLHLACPATNLAYKWLVRDLAAIGWLKYSSSRLD